MQTLFYSLIITLFSAALVAAVIALFNHYGARRKRTSKNLNGAIITVLLVSAFGVGGVLSVNAAETQMSEREHLARLVHELNALKPIVLQAQRAPKDPGRERFKYRAFNSDLKMMIDGLEQFIYRADQQPRSNIKPLSGGYAE